eukprot:CAMPEP_0172713860 /NCGR_PEP_ID=MMETSP1074-20121228/63972_1 /TAXON_ID=2916 /ORGANISM="Ceratium fusus, Strain PA161109" /LENGTH=159 /DNA_ID=CAMNT_0013538097 /DNA_START=53 /DNA_END=532 /DNA_ORIENTATION=-
MVVLSFEGMLTAKSRPAVTVASCPDSLLEAVKALRKDFRIHVSAGSYHDVLHRRILTKPCNRFRELLAGCAKEAFWKNPWRAKVVDRIENVRAMQDGPHILVCIPGGKACDWERHQLYKGGFVAENYAGFDLYLKVCTNADDLREFLCRKTPLIECLPI